MSKPYDRPAANPGGMDCQECGVIFVGEEWHQLCAVCEAHRVPAMTDTNSKAQVTDAMVRAAMDEARCHTVDNDLADYMSRIVEECIRAALVSTQAQASATPNGWKLVPVEPVPEMLASWYRYKNGHHWPDEPPPRD